jgi:hypothetical protein
MSHAFYSAIWQQAMEELSETIEIENPPVQLNEAGKPLPVRNNPRMRNELLPASNISDAEFFPFCCFILFLFV